MSNKESYQSKEYIEELILDHLYYICSEESYFKYCKILNRSPCKEFLLKRKKIKKLVEEGNSLEALEILKKDKTIKENKEMIDLLVKTIFIQLLKKGDYKKGIEFVREMMKKEEFYFDENIFSLLGYKNLMMDEYNEKNIAKKINSKLFFEEKKRSTSKLVKLIQHYNYLNSLKNNEK